MKQFTTCLMAVLLLCSFAGCTTETEGGAKAIVAKAITYADANGAEAAFTAINDPKGDFVRGDLYVFVVDVDGNYVAGAPFAEKRGKEMVSEDGKPIGRELATTATTEGTWISYQWKQPSTGTVTNKKSWVVRHANHVFGAGIYE
ncbi:MAG: cache domain-containing protein [Gammaproteobacteria bacterium]|nr:cache domain-containing protein [Gammaproteobacteria bacterium]MCI0590431.1 cache domain-containing protein [Gammaproteobacteria bacterium]